MTSERAKEAADEAYPWKANESESRLVARSAYAEGVDRGLRMVLDILDEMRSDGVLPPEDSDGD